MENAQKLALLVATAIGSVVLSAPKDVRAGQLQAGPAFTTAVIYSCPTGPITSLPANALCMTQIINAATIDQFGAAQATFTCSANPTIELMDCTNSTCSLNTNLGTVIATGTSGQNQGTITVGSLTAGHWVGWKITAGTCSNYNGIMTLNAHVN